MMNLADRLRGLAERLPVGGSLTLTRDGLLALAEEKDEDAARGDPRADLTVAEVAARLRRSPSTVRGWCEHGRFEGTYKLNGRDWRIPVTGLDAFLAEQRRERAPAQLDAWRSVRKRHLSQR